MYEYTTKGTCSKKIRFEIEDGKLHSVNFEEGCNGNLKALGILVEGMDAREVAQKLKGLCCKKRGTSCGDQLARAIEANL
jgi:uncharacterized protein (TIGR03905 family)